ncbi:MAG: hypothetical protein M3464_18585 [Chloroflexota bacterium]|nr:hypothetical protein [Chloroflexota bacterium]
MSAATVYAASRAKHHRRTNAEIATITEAMARIIAADHPMTLRGLYYRLVSEGLIPKTENEYEKVGRYLLNLRRDGTIPYAWIADHTRWMRKYRTYNSLENALWQTAATYRRALWNDQAAYVEIWCEKDTLACILDKETATWDVPLMVVRGFASESYVYEASQHIAANDKPAYLYLLTDHDPSGLASARDVERKITNFLPSFPVTVERVSVTEAQIAAWKLPTRPTKQSDSRARDFTGESVELDAIPPATLRELVRSCIERHIDPDVLARTKDVERLERERLDEIADNLADSEWGEVA